ncbi:MAG: hypothetical protein FJ304_20250 [Planctomycetes bacterium]|nr:hypothetical protein [Planctomycetota bacterium]
MKPTNANGLDFPTNPHEEPTMTTTAPTAPDPFDPASLRLTGEFTAAAGVKKLLLTVPVRKPDKSWFVRVHPSDAYRLETAVIELKEERETYLVASPLWADLAAESTFSPRVLFTAMNRQNVLFIWPCRLPGSDGKLDEWSRSALEATTHARRGWVRVQSNMNLGAYEVSAAGGNIPDPDWPATSFADLLRIAFKDRLIETLDHPVLRRLRGEL